MRTLKDIYLDGICLAKKWLLDAQLKKDEKLIQVYQNILDVAVRNYETQFGKE